MLKQEMETSCGVLRTHWTDSFSKLFSKKITRFELFIITIGAKMTHTLTYP